MNILDLPCEIIIMILQYLPTIDMIKFCDIMKKDEFLEEKKLIKKLDFHKAPVHELHRVDIPKIINKRMEPTFVTFLNINCIYWIPANFLRDCIKKLTNLHTLHALDTKLSIKDQDCETYNVLKINELAVNVQLDFVSCADIFPKSVVSFCVKLFAISQHQAASKFQFFITKLKKLQNFWIYNASPSFAVNYEAIAVNLPNLNKFVIKSSRTLPRLNLDCHGLKNVYWDIFRMPIEFIFEKVERGDILIHSPELSYSKSSSTFAKSWEVFEFGEKPYGPIDAIMLKKGAANFDTIEFKEFKLIHDEINQNVHNQSNYRSGTEILNGENFKFLRKLTIQSCHLTSKDMESATHVPKKARTEEPTTNFALKFSNLEELEFLYCKQTHGISACIPYNLIYTLTNLKKLVVEVPIIVNGSFLKELFENCQSLEHLQIICLNENPQLNLFLCQHVKKAKSLKDLKLVNKQIPLDKLFECVSNCNIERLYIKCNYIEKLSVSPIRHFLEKNPQLIFLVLLIETCTAATIKAVQNTLNGYRNAPSIFFAKKTEAELKGNSSIPPAHCDIMDNSFRHCTIDFYNFTLY